MNTLTKNIPNLLTLTNLCCGTISIIFAFQGNFSIASLCIFTGALFDFLDGLFARLLSINSEFGKQLDSMADMTTFGIAPSFILFHFMFYIDNDMIFRHSMIDNDIFISASLAFLIPIFSAYRLAKFNIDNKQSNSFIGLPTPALGIFFAAIPHINFNQFPIFTDIQFLIILAIIMPILLIIKAPLFSLKFNLHEKINSKLNIFRICLVISSIILFFIFKFGAIPFIIFLYLFLSTLNNLLQL